MNKTLLHIRFLYFCLLIIGCASQGRPNGGPKDETPPQVVEGKSTPNYQTNFEQREINIEFDEFIKLKDVFKNVLISPPMLNFPEITERGKKLRVKFDPIEIIREDVTYTFNFGNAITDYHEGNPLENYRFVFSTGDYIDSLEISGKITDFKTHQPLSGIPVILYDNLDDSIIYKERPFYFAKTDENGFYKISNIKKDSFQLFAIDDQNLNYYLDQDNESIAFLDSILVMTDSLFPSIDLALSIIDPPAKITDKIADPYGKLTLALSKPLLNLDYKILDTVEHTATFDHDTLHIWYHNYPDSSIHINILNDSLRIKLKNYSLDTSKYIPQVISQTADKGQGISPSLWQEITFNTPIVKFNKDSISLLDTAMINIPIQIKKDSVDQRKIWVKAPWIENGIYELNILPNAIENFYGLQNDSISLSTIISEKAKFGNLYPSLINMDSSSQYIVYLNRNDNEIEHVLIKNQSSAKLSFENLKPGKYKLIIINDKNNNYRWDHADYQTKTAAEAYAEIELPDLKANWDDESEIDIKKIMSHE